MKNSCSRARVCDTMKKKISEVPTMQLVRKTENGYETDDVQAALKKDRKSVV